MPLMSDEEAFGAPAVASTAISTPSPGLLSDEEAFSAPTSSGASSAPESRAAFGSNRGVAATEPGASDDFAKSGISAASRLPMLASDLGTMVAQGAGRVAGTAYTSMGGELSPQMAEALTNMNALPSSAETYRKLGIPVHEPETALGEIGAIMGQSAAPLMEGTADKILGRAASIPEKIKSWYDAPITEKPTTPAVAPLTQAEKNIAYFEDRNANAENMKMSYGHIYDGAGEISQDVTISAPKMKANVDAMVDDMDKDLAHKTEQGSSQAYRDMKAAQDAFDESGNIPLDKVTLLKRRLNDLYDPNMGDARGKIYANLNNQLNNLIKQAKVENPEWGKMMDAGNNLFKNYKGTFSDSDLAYKKDYEDAQAARKDDPYSAPASEGTRTAISNITNVETIQQYEDMLRKLSPDMHEQFTQDVLANNPSNSRLGNAIRAIYKGAFGNKFGAANDLYRAATESTKTGIDPALAENFPHVNDAITHHYGVADTAYKSYLDKLESASAPVEPPAAPTLALTERRPMVPEGGSLRPMTDAEWQNSIDVNKGAVQMDNTIPTRAAAEARRTTAADRAAKARALYEQWGARGASPLGREAVRAGAMPFKNLPESVPPFLKDTFKRGGAVNTQPTDKQKAAGNYKKSHVKVHGLDISIENPKGSVRTGTGKDGKEWESPPMPAHYGYLRGTVGGDGDHVDCFIGENTKSKRVYVIDQKGDDGRFDEHKVIFQCADRDEAVRLYRGSFSDKKNRIMKVTRMTIPEFKAWIKEGNTRQPVKKAA